MIEDLKVLALIPARGGSKGIPQKNITPLAGKPLIAWTIEAAKRSQYIDRLVLSSDCADIQAVALEYGCEVPFTRSAELATDEAGTMDVVMDTLKRINGYDILVLLQTTSPLRLTADIDGCLEALLQSKASACVSVKPANEHPYLSYRILFDGTISAYAKPPVGESLRRQDLPPAWCLNGAVYAAYCKYLCATNNFIGVKTIAFPMPAGRSIDIDTLDDLDKAEFFYNKSTNY